MQTLNHEHEADRRSPCAECYRLGARQYVAGWNMAGYLPETDPETFDTLDDAIAYLRETLDEWWDQDGTAEGATGYLLDSAPEIDTDGRTYADAWYGDIHLWAEAAAD